MEKQYRHFVRICNSPVVFCKRYGLMPESELGHLFHSTIIALLKANEIKGEGFEAHPVSVACWADNMADGGETVFEANEATAETLYKFNVKFRKAVDAEKKALESVGRSFLLQQCKQDLLSEI